MKKVSVSLMSMMLYLCCGCNLLESLVSNVDDWDLSACVSGFSTCWELYWDNSDKFDSSFIDGITIP